MPVNLLVDEAYAFDYLSILEVKYNKTKKLEQAEAFSKCVLNLSAQLSNYYDVVNSKEYEELVKINQLIFETIDILKKRDINAMVVDGLNYQRYEAKRNLQNKFFPSRGLVEIKIGYS